MQISVIIPSYKETDRLHQTLTEIFPYLESKFKDFEVIIVDDPDSQGGYTQILSLYSEDKRIQFIKQAQRFGKGAAVKKGCLMAKGEIVLFMDADHSTPITELDQCLPFFKAGEDLMVAGARMYQDSESKWRRIIGLLSQLYMHLVLFERAVVDSQCGFKVFNRGLVQKVFPLLKIDGGMMDAELFFLLHKLNIKVQFVTVKWDNKPGSKINVIKCMIFDPIELLKVKIRSWFGLYSVR